MSALRALVARIFATVGLDRRGSDLDEEIRAHIGMQADELVRGGMSPEDARRTAALRFGPVEGTKNTCRDLRVVAPLESLVRDVTYSARLLRRSPGFALMAFLTLAIGIGATTAVFSLVNRAILRPLPVHRPHELVALNNTGTRGMFGMDTFSHPDYLDLRDRSRSFAGIVAYSIAPMAVSSNGVSERLWGFVVSGNYFDLLGVRPAPGSAFAPVHDVQRGAHPVTVISFRFWQSRFGSDPDVVGRSIVVNGRAYTVIGVAPRGFSGTEVAAAPDLWFPLGMQDAIQNVRGWLDDRGVRNLFLVGRLAPGVGRDQASAELEAVTAQLAREHPDSNEGRRVTLSRPGLFGGAMRGPLLGFAGLLLGIAALVLLLACVNLANLLLARAIDRRREVAVRLSIGAGRRALVRQLLVESLMLSAAAGAAGLVFAWWLMRATAAIRLPVDIPLALELPLDARVLLFNLLVSVAAAALFGLVPALQATKADLASVLKDSSALHDRHGAAWRNALIVVQVAVSLVLLAGAGLMWRALGQTRAMALGFSSEGAIEVSFDLRLQGYDSNQGRERQQRLLEAVTALPEIRDAALADVVPIDLHFGRARVAAENTVAERDARTPVAYFSRVTPGYFRTMRTRLLEGRDFTPADDERGAPVAIVNRALARRLWPGGGALGRRVRIGTSPPFEVVGIVDDGKYGSFNDERALAIHRPLRQSYTGATTVVARTSGDPATALGRLRAAVRDLDPNMPIASSRTFDERLAVPLLPARVTAAALAGFGALALVLAAIGLYGVMSYSVSSRTREIGIRMALGAQRADVLHMVFGEGGRLMAIGMIAGLAFAVLVTRLMRALLFGISPTDPITFAAVVAMLSAVAFMACWVPARRALRTDPVVALRG